MSPLGTAGLGTVLAALAMAPLPEELRAAAGVTLLLWLPGRGLARHLSDDPLLRPALAVAVAVGAAGPVVLLARGLGLGAAGVAAGAVGLAALSAALPAAPARALAPGPALGRVALGVALLATAWAWRDTIRRPLDAYWWGEGVEEGFEGGGSAGLPRPGRGWEAVQPLGGGDGQALVLRADSDHPYLSGPVDGRLVLVLRGPVGARLGAGGAEVVVEADPVVDPEEGPVPRYLEEGAAALPLDLHLGAGDRLELELSQPRESLLYVLPSAEALWELHGRGTLRFVHYYQLLNMVEQLRWARELGVSRWVTDVQPPLWTWALAGPVLLAGGGLPTTNVALLLLLGATGAATLAALVRLAPRAPLLAWTLPALALAEHAKLLYEPGSAGLPDTLYTFFVLLSVAGLTRSGPGFVFAALGAQLSRYPGALLTGLAALFAGSARRIAALAGAVGAAALGFAAVGTVTGELPGWLETVWWETGPEHWHGEASPGVLLARVPAFYLLWLGYAGGAPLLAALAPGRAVRQLLGTAVTYSLLLCTIDHTPSHYFLPLLHLSVAAAVCATELPRSPWLRRILTIAVAAGLWISLARVAVTG